MPFWDVFVVMQDCCCCSVSKLYPTLCDPMIFSTPGFSVLNYLWACPNSWPLSQWCHPAISTSVTPFSCCHSFPASGSFPMSQLFASGGRSIGASTLIFPMSTRVDFLLDWLVWSPCCPMGLSRVFSSTTVQKRQFFSSQPSLWSNSHIHTWLLEKL